MSDLPEHPHIVQVRRRAKDLLKQARAGDPDALARLASVSAPVTLAGAQLALAREFGRPSWPALVREIEARNTAIPATVLHFLRSSVNANIMQAARLLYENPELAESGFAAAVVLGDVARVAAELRRDPAVATRVDPGTGWTALHLACASRFHLDPQRAPGLVDVVRMLVDAGANIDGESTGTRCWRPLKAPSRAPTPARTTSQSSDCCSIAAPRSARRRCWRLSMPRTDPGAWTC